MKRIVSAIAALALVAILAAPAAANKPDKVLVCHAAGQAGTTKYVTLEVPANEGGYPQGHFTEGGTTAAGHEDDYLGACEEEPTPTEPQATPTEPQATPTEVVPTPTLTCDLPEGCDPPTQPATDMSGTNDDGPTAPILPLMLAGITGASLLVLRTRKAR